MITRIVVFPPFDEAWPFAADRLLALLQPITDVTLERLPAGGAPAPGAGVERLFWLGTPIDEATLDSFGDLREAHITEKYRFAPAAGELLEARGIRRVDHGSEGYWGQSVAEFALGLTIAALRRIPQGYHGMLSDPAVWTRPAEQFSDDERYTNGTVAGKRVRIVGAGNIASRYASFTRALGADVAAWDPFAPEPSFHRTGARREHDLQRLVRDAQIFAPMVPLLPSTTGLVTAELIDALPQGCLVVLATRAEVCDMPALRRRVLAGELALAADVFDAEPVPFDDPLLGRDNVVHTPHNAGRTRDASLAWAEMLVAQLEEYDPAKVPSV